MSQTVLDCYKTGIHESYSKLVGLFRVFESVPTCANCCFVYYKNGVAQPCNRNLRRFSSIDVNAKPINLNLL